MRSTQQLNAANCEVFDAEFKFAVEVPTAEIVHLPPQRLNITRLVFCRNYRPHEPASCQMGASCKFVHTDADLSTLEHHPVHVNYAWRNAEMCIYDRLAPGELLRVHAPANRTPAEDIPSDRVLVTRGSLSRHDHSGPLAHCAHYTFNRMCNRGERCNFIHTVFVDPNVVGDFKRAPGKSLKAKLTDVEEAIMREQDQLQHQQQHGDLCDSSCGHCDSDTESSTSGDAKAIEVVKATVAAAPPLRCYRHNPYSLMKVAVWV